MRCAPQPSLSVLSARERTKTAFQLALPRSGGVQTVPVSLESLRSLLGAAALQLLCCDPPISLWSSSWMVRVSQAWTPETRHDGVSLLRTKVIAPLPGPLLLCWTRLRPWSV